MSEIKIMIVEDQELIRSSLEIVLNMEDDLKVTGLAANGQEAVHLCEAGGPDIILMDINMPVMNGIEATRIIKDRWPAIKIIILTTFQDMDYVLEALNAGAEGYLLKAIDTNDLASGIRMVQRGGSLLPQDTAKLIFSQMMNSSSPKETASKENEYGLSERELEVLRYISDGFSNRVIAERLFLSEGTVKNYISSIYSKLDVPNRTSALKKIKEEGII